MSLFRESASGAAEPTSLVVDGSTQFLAVSLPPKTSAAYPTLLEMVKGAGFQLEPSNRKWWLRDRHRVLEFLARHLPDLREKYRAQFTPSFQQRTAQLKYAKLSAGTSGPADEFNVS